MIWFQFQQPNNDKPKLAKRPSETTSQRCEVVDGSVYDGDTFRVKCDGKEQKIRLCGIDAPEAKQPLGIESSEIICVLWLPKLQRSKSSLLKWIAISYGRTVAEVLFDTPEGEQSVQEEMLKAGMVYHYKQFSGNCHNS